MRKNAYLLLMAVVLFAACNSPYKKGEEGMEYKIIADGKGETLKPGQFIEFHFTSVYNDGKKDTILNSTRDMGVRKSFLSIRQIYLLHILNCFSS